MKLNNKVAVVTGGGSGIGRGISLKFAQEGAKVFIIDFTPDSAEKVTQEIKNIGGEALGLRLDIVNSKDVDMMIEVAVEKAGCIDILVNSAGRVSVRSVLEMDERHWDRCIDIYLKGTFLCAQAAAKKMVEKKIPGKIINISSINSFVAVPGFAAYCAAKAGVEMLTKVMALEFAQYGIRVNCIAPGPVATAATRQLFVDSEEGRKKFLKQMPIGRIGEPEDIAEVAIFLASSSSDFITGQTVVADGGMSLIGEPNVLDILRKDRDT